MSVPEQKARDELRRLATPASPAPSTFSRARWPYTYAYDHYRGRIGHMSRGEAGVALRALAGEAGIPFEFVATMLATAYCVENNITIPGGLE